MSITGDFATLASMRRRLENAPKAATRAAETAAPLLVDSTRDAVQNGTTLGGRALGDKAATFKRGTSAPLERTGALLASLEPVHEGSQTGIRFTASYAKYALKDFFPKEVPRNWVEILRGEAIKALNETMEGA